MPRSWLIVKLTASLLAWLVVMASASSTSSTASDRPLALPELIEAAANRARLHPDLLASIVWVESRAWPWALNVRGQSLYPRTRADAERALAAVGDKVDIGYAQVNYYHWGRPLGYRKVDLLDPWTNLLLGARILRHSMAQEPGWPGVGRYHSAMGQRKAAYAAQVVRVYHSIQAYRRHTHRGKPLLGRPSQCLSHTARACPLFLVRQAPIISVSRLTAPFRRVGTE